MTILTTDDYIQVPGKVEVLVAFPNVYTDLHKLGESENGISIRKLPVLGEVYGDRHGGQSGRPIERQFFGLAAEFMLSLSRWDPVQVRRLETMGGILTEAGTVPLSTVGCLMHRDHSIRVYLYSVKDPTLSLNFPCCIWSQPQERGHGSKYANVGIPFVAERCPEGHWSFGNANPAGGTVDKSGVVYDVDEIGLPSPYVPT